MIITTLHSNDIKRKHKYRKKQNTRTFRQIFCSLYFVIIFCLSQLFMSKFLFCYWNTLTFFLSFIGQHDITPYFLDAVLLTEQLFSSSGQVIACSRLTVWRSLNTAKIWQFNTVVVEFEQVHTIILISSIKLLKSIISKHCNVIFALTLNCHDNYSTIFKILSVIILLDDWGLCFCFNVPWRNYSIDSQCGSFVYTLFGACYWKEF